MARNHFYLGLQKQVAMPQNTWNKLIAFFEGTPDVLDVDGNLVTAGTPPTVLNYAPNGSGIWLRHNIAGDKVIYEALFDDVDVSLLAIRQKLANVAGVALNTITTSSTQINYGGHSSAVVTFRFNGTPMFIMALFGRTSDSQVIDWIADSEPAAQAFLVADTAGWDGQ